MLKMATRGGVSRLATPLSRKMSSAADSQVPDANIDMDFRDRLKPWRGTNLQPLRIKAHGIQVLQVKIRFLNVSEKNVKFAHCLAHTLVLPTTSCTQSAVWHGGGNFLLPDPEYRLAKRFVNPDLVIVAPFSSGCDSKTNTLHGLDAHL
jgi:hypothetical protein